MMQNSTSFDTMTGVDDFIKVNFDFDALDNELASTPEQFSTYFQKTQLPLETSQSQSLSQLQQTSPSQSQQIRITDEIFDSFPMDDFMSFKEPVQALKDSKNLMFSSDPSQLQPDEGLSQTKIYQIIPDDSSLPSITSSSNDLSSISQGLFDGCNYTTGSEFFTTLAKEVSDELNFDEDSLVLKNSPLSVTDYQQDRSSPHTSSHPSPNSQLQYTPDVSPDQSNSSTPSSSSLNHGGSENRKSSLDSRLSLQKLGEILHTSSFDETVKIEKFILNIFGKELGFPLGYKTWIRDTNENYRSYLLNELHKRVTTTYPDLTKNLLETVIKRATYSMMQGRLRKERRAVSKLNKKKNSGK